MSSRLDKTAGDAGSASPPVAVRGADDDAGASGSFERYMEHAPNAVAVTHGPAHILVYSNLAFRRITDASNADIGRPIADVVQGHETMELGAELDRVIRSGAVPHDGTLSATDDGAADWHFALWPELGTDDQPEHIIVEMWNSSRADLTLSLQREVAERMLLTTLRELEASVRAEKSSRRAMLLASEGRRLAESLDEQTTWNAVARLALPTRGDWCIVDVLGDNGAMRRLRIVHPDPAKQALLKELEGVWQPAPGDPFGLPAMIGSRTPTVIDDEVNDALERGAHDPAVLRVLRSVEIGSLLTVPLVIRESLLGALTFVSRQHEPDDRIDNVALAEDFAIRSAMALDSARMHGEALAQRGKAETASSAKSAFLATMSHELRTPLNAIGGYVDLILMGLRGEVTNEQRIDLHRVKRNQRHLLGLISDLLNFVRVDSGHLSYTLQAVAATEAVGTTVSLIDALLVEKGITCDIGGCNPAAVAYADPEKLQQILINLFSNAIKFTAAGGRISVDCQTEGDAVRIRVTDTGIGIPAEKLESIFDPFVQVKEGFADRDSGVGLGLAISRELTRGMGGDLVVESELGHGSRFTIVLPRSMELIEE